MFWRIGIISLVLVIPFSIWLAPGFVAVATEWVVFFAPLWLPPLLLIITIPLWLTYVRSQYAYHIPYTVLELKPGDKTLETAHAMELVLYSLHRRTELSRIKAFLLGEFRVPWSFEITATAGTVRFFMRIPRAHRQALEMRIRSEYKDIDIDEIRDYARVTHFDATTMKLSAREYALTQSDPYPLKTYDMYTPDNHKKDIPPFYDLTKQLLSVGEQEYLYISYTVRPHQLTEKAFWRQESDTLHRDAQFEITKLLGAGGDIRSANERVQKQVAAIETALKKPAFDCGIRALYFADKTRFNDSRVQTLDTLFDAFNDTELNSLVAHNPREYITWPLSDIFNAVPFLYENYMHYLYRRRAFFAPPHYGKTFVLNTAELATLYHVPQMRRANTLSHASGKRLEPPENLPV
ncbi:MAG: hypothetical protein ACJKTH_02740 [Patescibacteria group bacterium UBA2163]